MPQECRGPEHQKPAQISISLFGDVAEPHLAARPTLAWHQADPGGQVAARAEGARIRNGGRKRAGRDDADAGDRLQALADLVRTMPGQDLLLGLSDLDMGLLELGDDQAHTPPCQVRQGCPSCLRGHFPELGHARQPLRSNDAVLGQMTAQSIDQHGPLPHEQLARAVEHQHGLLLWAFDGHIAHGRAGHGLANTRSIKRVAFAAFDIRLYVGCGHKPNFVPEGRQLSCPEVGGGTRLHPNQAGRQAPEEADELTSPELTANENLSVLIDAMNLEHMLGEIETYCRDMHWSGSLSGAEAITLSHRALPGAGAVHLIIYETGQPCGAVLLDHLVGAGEEV